MGEQKLTKYEVAAMWLYGEDYAQSGLSAAAYWSRLSSAHQNTVIRMVDEILEAPFGTYGGARLHTMRGTP